MARRLITARLLDCIVCCACLCCSASPCWLLAVYILTCRDCSEKIGRPRVLGHLSYCTLYDLYFPSKEYESSRCIRWHCRFNLVSCRIYVEPAKDGEWRDYLSGHAICIYTLCKCVYIGLLGLYFTADIVSI